jgi:hypothetical protein
VTLSDSPVPLGAELGTRPEKREVHVEENGPEHGYGE